MYEVVMDNGDRAECRTFSGVKFVARTLREDAGGGKVVEVSYTDPRLGVREILRNAAKMLNERIGA